MRKSTATKTVKRSAARDRARIAAGVVVAWVLILGVIVGFGELVVKYSHDKWLGDTAIPRWFAAHRTPTLNTWSNDVSVACATTGILIVAVAACVIFLAVIRHWRPVIFIAVVMFGELAAFLAAAAVVKRPRPYVPHLDHHLPTSAYPSGHVAATTCLYVAIAIVVMGHTRGWWRWLFVALAVVMPVAIALSRMYRGEHHPTDVLGSLIFAALWLTATTLLIKPNAELPERSPGHGRARSSARVRAGGFAAPSTGQRHGNNPLRRCSMTHPEDARRVEIKDGDQTVAAAEVSQHDGGTARASLHASSGHVPPGRRADLVDAVVDLPEVQASSRLEATIPLGDGETPGPDAGADRGDDQPGGGVHRAGGREPAGRPGPPQRRPGWPARPSGRRRPARGRGNTGSVSPGGRQDRDFGVELRPLGAGTVPARAAGHGPAGLLRGRVRHGRAEQQLLPLAPARYVPLLAKKIARGVLPVGQGAARPDPRPETVRPGNLAAADRRGLARAGR